MRKFIETVIIANRSISGREISDLVLQKYNVSVSKSAINVYWKYIGFKYGPQIKTFLLTEEQKARRLAFAKRNINSNFKNVLFIDESYFELNGLHWICRKKAKQHGMFTIKNRPTQLGTIKLPEDEERLLISIFSKWAWL